MLNRTLATLAALVFTASAVGAQTPDRRLVRAVKANETVTANALLRAKANPNVADVDGTTPLQWAVRNSNTALVDRLLAAGADAKAQNRFGVTAIQLACENGSAPLRPRC